MAKRHTEIPHKVAELLDVTVGRLVAPLPQDVDRLSALHPTIANFQRQVVEQRVKPNLYHFK